MPQVAADFFNAIKTTRWRQCRWQFGQKSWSELPIDLIVCSIF
jgi:hypothetical protein